MKFTKEQLLDTLKEKLTANGKHLSISDKTIKSLSDSHYDLLVSEETELDDLVGKILPQYVSLNGNYEKDNSEFIKKWKEEHPDTKPAPKNAPKPKEENEPSETEKKLLERLEALEKKNAEHEEQKIISDKRSQLLSKFKEKGISDARWIEKYMRKLNITKDSDIEQEITDAEEFYNVSHVSRTRTPGSSQGNQPTKAEGAERWKGVNKALGSVTPSQK